MAAATTQPSRSTGPGTGRGREQGPSISLGVVQRDEDIATVVSTVRGKVNIMVRGGIFGE